MCKKLVQIAARTLEVGLDLLYGIEACNEVLDGRGSYISDALRHECLCIRAALFLKVSTYLIFSEFLAKNYQEL